MTTNNNITGKVILAGAGPGDPELVTLKTVRHLQQADIVLVDRLVSDELLKQHVNAKAEIIYVGKQCTRGSSTPQETINQLMVEFALQGKNVVRLKGGDVSIFSNVLDELQALVKHQIPYEIVPGITAALGAAAYAAIPLTARGYTTAVRFITSYKSDIITDEYWKELSQTDDTLVFYMSSETLDEVVTNLTKNNIAADKLLAVIEQATTPLQNVYVSGLYEYDQSLKGKKFISPSLVIIGKVVALREQFNWLGNSHNDEHYFKPLAKLYSTIPEVENADKKTKHVSRA
jgi:uroporphyrin-III C-methyltransferase